jgi:hypothetical protein
VFPVPSRTKRPKNILIHKQRQKRCMYAHAQSSFRNLRFENSKNYNGFKMEIEHRNGERIEIILPSNIYQLSISSSVAVEAIMNACNVLCLLSMMKEMQSKTKHGQLLEARITPTN